MVDLGPHRLRLLGAVALAVVFLLRFQGLDWDQGRGFHPDELNLVTAARDLIFPGGMIPSFHAYNGLALAAPKALSVAVCGPGPDMACLTWAARALSALCATGTVVLGALIARRLGGARAAALALLLLGLSAPLLQWAHFGTTESALTLAVLAAWLQALRLLDETDSPWRAAVGFGLILGLGLGMKTSAAVLAVFPLGALLLAPTRLRGQEWLAVPAGAAVTAGLFVLTTPALIFATADYLSVMRFEGDVVAGRADVFWTWQFTGATPVLFEARQLWGLLDGTGLLLAGVGIAVMLRQRSRGAVVAIAFLAVYLAIIAGWHARFSRYLAPALPVLLVFAALGADRLWALARGQTARIALGLALLLPAVSGLSLAASYRFPDSRLVAAELLAGRLQPGDTVLIEPREVGPASFDRAEVRVLPLMDPSDPGKAARIVSDLAQGDWMVIYSRRNWAVLPRLGDRFPELCGYYAALASGALGYEVAFDLRRFAPLGRLLEPDLAAEETRVVFDRPEVWVLHKVQPLAEADLLARITAPGQDCRPETLLAAFRRVR